MDILDLRHFTSRDLRPLLDDETQLWRELLRWDYRGSAEMILRYVDNRVLPGYVAVENERAWGYVFYLYESGKAVIGDVHVDRRCADRPQATRRLIESVLDALQNPPGAMRIESQLLLHPTGTAAGPFLDGGCVRFPRLFLSLEISSRCLLLDAAETGADYELRSWEKRRYQEAAQLIVDAYSGHIDSEINEQYGSNSGALRFLNNIVLFPGCGYFDPEASCILVHKPTQTLAGMLLCSRVSEGVGHITQLCLRPRHRGRGLGSALLRRCIRSLFEMGFDAATLTVTESNRNAVELYESTGFTTLHAFDAFVWSR